MKSVTFAFYLSVTSYICLYPNCLRDRLTCRSFVTLSETHFIRSKNTTSSTTKSAYNSYQQIFPKM